MATEDTQIDLIINKLSKEQFESITPVETELYFTPDTTEQDIAKAISDHNTSTTAHSDIRNTLSGKVTANTAITGATHTKITYDSKGLVTGGTSLSATDIPNLSLTKITDVTASATELNYVKGVTSSIQTQLNNKQPTISNLSTIESNATAGKNASDTISTYGNIVTHNASEFATSAQGTKADNAVQANTVITGATHTKITYDSKGLVTGGSNLQATDIPNLSLSKITDVTASATEVNYVKGVTSSIQTQLNNVVPNTRKINGQALTQDITIDALPSQTGQSGKFLTTDGTTASWSTVDSLPAQTGNEGKSLITNGTTASWDFRTLITRRIWGEGD